MTEKQEIHKPVCKVCGSSNMSFEAIASWDSEHCRLVCASVNVLPHDDSSSFCHDCGNENCDSWISLGTHDKQ